MVAKLDESEQAKYAKVIERSLTDRTYRGRLKAEPIAVLREAGINIPEGVEVRVRDFDLNTRYIFLPPMAEETLPTKGDHNG